MKLLNKIQTKIEEALSFNEYYLNQISTVIDNFYLDQKCVKISGCNMEKIRLYGCIERLFMEIYEMFETLNHMKKFIRQCGPILNFVNKLFY